MHWHHNIYILCVIHSAQFLSVTCIYHLPACLYAASVPALVLVPWLNKINLSILILNSTSLPGLHVPQDSRFTWPYFFALNFDDWLLCPTNVCSSSSAASLYIFNDNNRCSSIIPYHFSGGLYISIEMLLGSGNVLMFWGLREYFSGAEFVFFSVFLFWTRSSVPSDVFGLLSWGQS